MIKRILSCIPLLLAVLLVMGCGSDKTQRIAFEHFLKTRIIDAATLEIPTLTKEQRQAFGEYAQYYQPIESFHQALADQVQKPTFELVHELSPQPLSVILDHRGEIPVMRRQIRDLELIVVVEQEKAREAYVRFKPDLSGDLKEIYDQAFNKMVMQTSETYKTQIVAGIFDVLDSTWKVVDYADQNKTRIDLQDTSLETDNPVMHQLNQQLQTLAKKAEQLINQESSLDAAVFAKPA